MIKKKNLKKLGTEGNNFNLKKSTGRVESKWLLGHGIHASSQLGHLPGTGGGPRTPKGMGETPSDRVGRGA